MGLYKTYIFPWIVHLVCGNAKIAQYRRELLRGIQGKILEIGFGTGLNLPHYPAQVKKLTVVDPNPGMHRKAKKYLSQLQISVESHVLGGEKLPFENQTFDAVVSTFTLCSIPDVELALWELHRVLKPSGKLFFLEHGLSPDKKVQASQRRWNPLQKRLADGCHLDRDIARLVEQAGFDFLELKKFYHPHSPKMLGFFYQGIGQKRVQ